MLNTIRKGRLEGFTLIELLIVVAIIAILAAIAVPNFLEAQTRSKVSRAKADMRTLTTAIEAYAVDYNKYPDVPRTVSPVKLGLVYSRAAFIRISTPVAYITSGQLTDPFAQKTATTTVFFGYANAQACILNPDLLGAGVTSPTPNDGEIAEFNGHGYVLQSVGPDTINYALGAAFGVPSQNFNNAFWAVTAPQSAAGSTGYDFFYDTTNGTISTGDIVRTVRVQN